MADDTIPVPDKRNKEDDNHIWIRIFMLIYIVILLYYIKNDCKMNKILKYSLFFIILSVPMGNISISSFLVV